MPVDVSHIDLPTVDFHNLSRDQLRRIATLHSVRGVNPYNTTYSPGMSNKEELIRGLTRAREQGKIGATKTSVKTESSNITIKATNVIVFIEGKGCGEKGVQYVAALVHDDGRVVLAPLNGDAPKDFVDIEDYDNFWTTLDDLRGLVDALNEYKD